MYGQNTCTDKTHARTKHMYGQNTCTDKTHVRTKHMYGQKVLTKKGETIMFNRLKCDQKSQFSGIRTKPLNPRDVDI